MESPPQCLSLAVQRETSRATILWSARPGVLGYARNRWQQSWTGIPFVVVAVLVVWGATAGRSDSSGEPPEPFFLLWTFLFMMVGLGSCLSPVFALWKARRVFYVVTERSAIIFERTWSLKIQSFDASGFGGFERVSRGGQQGDILFQRNIERRGKGTHTTEVGFLGLRDYAEAEQALRNMMRSAHKPA